LIHRLEWRVQNIIIETFTSQHKPHNNKQSQKVSIPKFLTCKIKGGSKKSWIYFAKRLKRRKAPPGVLEGTKKEKGPFCLIAGGETTVTIKATAKGGEIRVWHYAGMN